MKEVKNLQLNCFHIEDDFRLRFLIDWVRLKFVVIVVLYRYSNLIYTYRLQYMNQVKYIQV